MNCNNQFGICLVTYFLLNYILISTTNSRIKISRLFSSIFTKSTTSLTISSTIATKKVLSITFFFCKHCINCWIYSLLFLTFTLSFFFIVRRIIVLSLDKNISLLLLFCLTTSFLSLRFNRSAWAFLSSVNIMHCFSDNWLLFGFHFLLSKFSFFETSFFIFLVNNFALVTWLKANSFSRSGNSRLLVGGLERHWHRCRCRGTKEINTSIGRWLISSTKILWTSRIKFSCRCINISLRSTLFSLFACLGQLT